jgi:tetratricopeptide (TPR) repeat protein
MTALWRLAALTVFVCPLVGQTFDTLMSQGVQLYNKSDLDGAIMQFETAVELEPKNKISLLHLANAHASRAAKVEGPGGVGAASRALALYRQVLEVDADNRTAIWNQAMVKLKSKDLVGAEAALERYLQLAPGSADAYYARGVIEWARAFPAQMQARHEAGQPPSDPAPISNPTVRDQFRGQHLAGVERGLASLRHAVILDPMHEEALAYRNLLLRTKADMAANSSDASDLAAQADQAIRRMLRLRSERVAATSSEPLLAELEASKPPPPLRAPLPPPPPPRRRG